MTLNSYFYLYLIYLAPTARIAQRYVNSKIVSSNSDTFADMSHICPSFACSGVSVINPDKERANKVLSSIFQKMMPSSLPHAILSGWVSLAMPSIIHVLEHTDNGNLSAAVLAEDRIVDIVRAALTDARQPRADADVRRMVLMNLSVELRTIFDEAGVVGGKTKWNSVCLCTISKHIRIYENYSFGDAYQLQVSYSFSFFFIALIDDLVGAYKSNLLKSNDNRNATKSIFSRRN